MFIKPSPQHWQPSDFDFSEVSMDASLLHITQTICLLESRCDDYAEYLMAILREREEHWTAAIDRWNFEECQRGETLRALGEANDDHFDFPSAMATYEALVSYHEPTGESARGSVAAEMVSRSVVEALASTLYRVLADSTEDETVRTVYSTLATDEARHYGMFVKMLNAEAEANSKYGLFFRCRCVLQRMFELEDSQIMLASCVIAGRADGTIKRRREANAYLAKLYRLYRWKHLRHAVRMLLRVLGLRATPVLVWPATTLLRLGVKGRLLLANLSNRFLPARSRQMTKPVLQPE